MERLTPSKMCSVIAIAGKGGVGKSALTAMMVKILSRENELKILAIDADPAMGLADALGVEVQGTIADVSDKMQRDLRFRRKTENFHIKDVIWDVIQQEQGFYFLSMGHDEGPGCLCGVNSLLKYGISSVSKDVDVIFIDCEAGIEQMKRRVLDRIDFLMGVTDVSARGFRVANLLKRIACVNDSKTKRCDMGLVINKVRHEAVDIQRLSKKSNIRIIGCVPEDEDIFEHDFTGRPLLQLPDDSPALVAIERILRKIITEDIDERAG
jgi:CO dehydrogenase maturation factor